MKVTSKPICALFNPTPSCRSIPNATLCNPRTGPPTIHGLLDTHHTSKEGWMVDCPTLTGSVGAEEIPSPQRFLGELQLLRSEEGRNSCPGHGSSGLGCMIWNAPMSVMWNGAGTPPMSCSPH